MRYFYLLIIFFSLFSCKSKKEIIKTDYSNQITEQIKSDYQNIADIIVSQITDNFVVIDKDIQIVITDFNDSNRIIKTTEIKAKENIQNKNLTDLTIEDKSKTDHISDIIIDTNISSKTKIEETDKVLDRLTKMFYIILFIFFIAFIILLIIKSK